MHSLRVYIILLQVVKLYKYLLSDMQEVDVEIKLKRKDVRRKSKSCKSTMVNTIYMVCIFVQEIRELNGICFLSFLAHRE